MNRFFVVGCPRSGTTVLQQALNRHSQIVIPPETKFFYSFYGKSKKQQAAHLERINADLGVNIAAPGRILHEPNEAREFFDGMTSAYLKQLGRDDVVCFGEKTPEHTGHLGRIRQVIPDAKVVFVYRDGRDVALSLSRMPWMHCDLYAGFVIWLYYHRILERELERPSFKTCFVRYETLASKPAEELGRVLRFLGVPFESTVAEGSGNREGVPRRELPWKARAIEKISADRIGLWQRELSRRQVGRLEQLGRQALVGLDYPLRSTKTRPLPPWFLATLAWSVFRCAIRLPLYCLGNEIVGSVSRYLQLRSYESRTISQSEPSTIRLD